MMKQPFTRNTIANMRIPKKTGTMLEGADDSTVTYELTPLKKGLFDIYEVEGFWCQETARKKHTIVVI